MLKVIVFDFEVFRYNTLLGAYIVNENKYFQTWDRYDIIDFYNENKDAVWVGHNNTDYDNYILQAIVQNKNPFDVSQNIINKSKHYYLDIKLNYYDLMQLHPGSLKVMEAAVGKNISETEVDFNINRPLTDEEKASVEKYNRDDLNQTFEDLKLTKSEFQLRLDLIKEFSLPLEALHYTQAQLAEIALNVKKNDKIIEIPVKPRMYEQLQVNNPEVIKYYLSEGFKTSEKPVFNICGLDHQMGAGGIHAGRKKCQYDWAYYFDVSGYYNLVMINYDLFSRTMSEESKKKYEYMYHEQIRLKKIDPVKRAVYKTILLAVFGAQMNKYSKFYDPWNGALVPVVGQMFLVDLLEKLEGKVELIQSNTDGIIAKPLVDEQEILDIVNEWQTRTGFVLKVDKIYDITQRDVNNYMYRDDKGNIHVKGEAVGYYENWDNPLSGNSYNSKEPIIIHYCIVEWFMNKKKPEETILKYSKNLRMFQYICKTNSYDYLTYEDRFGVQKLQKVNRVFASKESGMVYKIKKDRHDKYSNLPDKVFVFNDNLENLDSKRIDFIAYAKRAYERICEFKPESFKKITISNQPDELTVFNWQN